MRGGALQLNEPRGLNSALRFVSSAAFLTAWRVAGLSRALAEAEGGRCGLSAADGVSQREEADGGNSSAALRDGVVSLFLTCTTFT